MQNYEEINATPNVQKFHEFEMSCVVLQRYTTQRLTFAMAAAFYFFTSSTPSLTFQGGLQLSFSHSLRYMVKAL